jgi:hypothetical protein
MLSILNPNFDLLITLITTVLLDAEPDKKLSNNLMSETLQHQSKLSDTATPPIVISKVRGQHQCKIHPSGINIPAITVQALTAI